nr:hypothetical protein [Pandoravirus massiliensis]
MTKKEKRKRCMPISLFLFFVFLSGPFDGASGLGSRTEDHQKNATPCRGDNFWTLPSTHTRARTLFLALLFFLFFLLVTFCVCLFRKKNWLPQFAGSCFSLSLSLSFSVHPWALW